LLSATWETHAKDKESMFFESILKAGAFSMIAIGAGWTFAEIRRFFIHTSDFVSEAVDDALSRRTISLVCGLFFLVAGAALAFVAYELPVPKLVSTFPFLSDTPVSHPYVVRAEWGFAGLIVFSILSVWIFPPPLFPSGITRFFSVGMRGLLFAGWVAIIVYSVPHIGDHWGADAFGLGLALLTLWHLYSGSFENWGLFDEQLRPTSIEERPFSYVSTILLLFLAMLILMNGHPDKNDRRYQWGWEPFRELPTQH
jgi:hypothetical protein